jgi:argininosuccinate lyase
MGRVRLIAFAVLSMGPLVVAQPAVAQIEVTLPKTERDRLHWVTEGNKASLIALVEGGVIDRELGGRIARAIIAVDRQASRSSAPRNSNYLAIERELMAIVGPEASWLHSGRSRQDLGQVGRRAEWREAYLTMLERFIDARAALLALARTHPDAPLPFYTHGVQAQPTSLGHYLGGYLQALDRQSDRYREAWPRLNRSPLGGGVGGTSSYPLDRRLLSDLLGFERPIDNSFDAVQIALQDSGSDIAYTSATGALLVSMLSADLLVQYGNPYPWFQLDDGEQSGRSSIMPQKRNPSAIEELQEASGLVTALGASWTVLAQNVPSGLDSYKKTPIPLNILQASIESYGRMAEMLKALRFYPDRALDRLSDDYAVVTELANVLERDGGVPFRVGHHFASEMVNFGRANRMRSPDLPIAEARAQFTRSLRQFNLPDRPFPLTEPRFREALTPSNMLRSARPLGGPQPAEVRRMLAETETRLAADRRWLAERRAALATAERTLAARFTALARSGGR